MNTIKFDYTPWLKQYGENLPALKQELKNRKKAFNETKEEIYTKYQEYLDLLKQVEPKEIKVTYKVSKDIEIIEIPDKPEKSVISVLKVYTFEGENYPWELFNLSSSDEDYFGIDWLYRERYPKNLMDKYNEISELFVELQTLNGEGPGSWSRDARPCEDKAIDIIGQCLEACRDHLAQNFKRNNIEIENRNLNYYSPKEYSDNPTSFNFNFSKVTRQNVKDIKQIINETGFEIVRDEVRRMPKHNNYIVSIYCKEINEVEMKPRLFC